MVGKQRLVHFPCLSPHSLLPSGLGSSRINVGVALRLTNKQTNLDVHSGLVKAGGPVCFIVTRLPENKICRLCVQRKWNEWAGEPSSAYANECCDWLSLFLLSPATPSLQIRFQWEFFLFKDLLMVCNHLTINLTSELQAAQGGGCRKG